MCEQELEALNKSRAENDGRIEELQVRERGEPRLDGQQHRLESCNDGGIVETCKDGRIIEQLQVGTDEM